MELAVVGGVIVVVGVCIVVGGYLGITMYEQFQERFRRANEAGESH